MSTRSRWPHIVRERLALDEAVGQYVLKHPLVRAVRERPKTLVLSIGLGLTVVLSIVFAGTLAAILVLLVAVVTLSGVRLLALRRQDRPSRAAKPVDGSRLTLIVGWVAALFGAIAVIAWFEAATGSTGIVIAVGFLVALPILGKLLQVIFRV